MRIGVLFGGQSREREISFAGGRTVYDNLNKAMFEPVPIFVDSFGNFILLKWQYLYKGSIRDFYPLAKFVPKSEKQFQPYIEALEGLNESVAFDVISEIGRQVYPHEFQELFDFAFLVLHGSYGEDGNIQGLLEWHNIPYSGCGILPSAIGIDKSIQRTILNDYSFSSVKSIFVSLDEWSLGNSEKIFKQAKEKVGFPLVVKAPHEGSSIGVSVLKENTLSAFQTALDKSFFIQRIDLKSWTNKDEWTKEKFIQNISDIRTGLGFPLFCDSKLIKTHEKLWKRLDQLSKDNESCTLTSSHFEKKVLIESFIYGREFSCIVIEDENGCPIALPPTEIVKASSIFDYRAKYLPGISRKITPINASEEGITKIRKECERLYKVLNCTVYARIDGFLSPKGEVLLNDPNTTSGMLPSSFFFHQAAEIGFNPSQFLTYIIRTSLQARIRGNHHNPQWSVNLKQLDKAIRETNQEDGKKKKVAVMMGGLLSERHISVESGRNIYEKLSSSTDYLPIPVFLTGSNKEYKLYELPVNIMLKDNADDISEKAVSSGEKHPLVKRLQVDHQELIKKYTGGKERCLKSLTYEELATRVDAVFIALHGHPGEDGTVQKELEKVRLPYNGSGVESSRITINKSKTNKLLRKNGILVADHDLVYKQDWQKNITQIIRKLEKQFAYPFIAKPVDDGCSSAVKKINNINELIAFAELMFREESTLDKRQAQLLGLKPNEEFSQKESFMIETLIEKEDANHFIEITGGMLTHRETKGDIRYEVFDPSEVLASGEVLSLEDKFLAGEGQNITPARFSKYLPEWERISKEVKSVLEKTARILNVEGYCRIDAFVKIYSTRVDTYVIEVNSLPGMTPATCIFHQGAINGYKPYDLINAILKYGQSRMKNTLRTTITA